MLDPEGMPAQEATSTVGAGTETTVSATTGTTPNAVGQPAGEDTPEARALSAAYEAAGIKPAAPAAAVPAPSPQLTPEQIELLGKLDPASLPKEILEKFDRHLLPAFTRKTQALAEERRGFESERQRWLERMEKLERRFGSDALTREDADDIRARARAGDPDALEQYAQTLVEKELAPLKREQAYAKAVSTAEEVEPTFRELKGEVFEQLKDQPVLTQLMEEKNGAYAPLVLVALTREALLNRALSAITDLQKKSAESEAAFADRLRRGIEAHQKALRGLPATSSLAGSTAVAGGERVTAPDMAAAKARLIASFREAGLGD